MLEDVTLGIFSLLTSGFLFFFDFKNLQPYLTSISEVKTNIPLIDSLERQSPFCLGDAWVKDVSLCSRLRPGKEGASEMGGSASSHSGLSKLLDSMDFRMSCASRELFWWLSEG